MYYPNGVSFQWLVVDHFVLMLMRQRKIVIAWFAFAGQYIAIDQVHIYNAPVYSRGTERTIGHEMSELEPTQIIENPPGIYLPTYNKRQIVNNSMYCMFHVRIKHVAFVWPDNMCIHLHIVRSWTTNPETLYMFPVVRTPISTLALGKTTQM